MLSFFSKALIFMLAVVLSGLPLLEVSAESTRLAVSDSPASRKAIQAPVEIYRKQKFRYPIIKNPLILEVQRVADRLEGDINIRGDWVIDMSTETASVLRLRFTQPDKAPSTVSYEVYRGSLISPKSGKRARPVISAVIGAPPGKGKIKEFDVNFKNFLPPEPDGQTYLVMLVGSTATGVGVWSNIVKVSYIGDDWGKEFSSPVITRVIGTKDAMGNELKYNQVPRAVIGQIFQIQGTDINEVPAETRIKFLKKGKLVREEVPVHKYTQKLSSGQTLIAVRTPHLFGNGIYDVQIRSPWGTTSRIPIFVGLAGSLCKFSYASTKFGAKGNTKTLIANGYVNVKTPSIYITKYSVDVGVWVDGALANSDPEIPSLVLSYFENANCIYARGINKLKKKGSHQMSMRIAGNRIRYYKQTTPKAPGSTGYWLQQTHYDWLKTIKKLGAAAPKVNVLFSARPYVDDTPKNKNYTWVSVGGTSNGVGQGQAIVRVNPNAYKNTSTKPFNEDWWGVIAAHELAHAMGKDGHLAENFMLCVAQE